MEDDDSIEEITENSSSQPGEWEEWNEELFNQNALILRQKNRLQSTNENDSNEENSIPKNLSPKHSHTQTPKKENLEEAGTCVICMDAKISRIAIPCGHFSYCENCVDNIEKTCAICRGRVTTFVKVYL
jgi:hypothetical protein